MPRTLPSSACVQVPKFGLETIGKSASLPEPSQTQHLNQDIKKITSSVSTLRIPNQKPQDNKVMYIFGISVEVCSINGET